MPFSLESWNIGMMEKWLNASHNVIEQWKDAQ
jgi:hypothetical protein